MSQPPPEAGPTEDALVAQAIGGDRAAFTRLYDLHYDRVYRHVLYRVSSVQDAEDLTQMVFLQAWRAIGRYRPTGSPFVAWLLTIAHNLVVSFYRRQHVTTELAENTAEARADRDPEQAAQTSLEGDRIRAAIRRLRPDQQQVIVLRFLENLPHRDIAQALGKSEGAVRVIQHRALAELRRILEGDLGR